jgi:hydrogenase maturation protease
MSPHPSKVPPVLVFAYGDPARGDDAIGPEFARRLGDRCGPLIDERRLEVQTDFQLQPDHAHDLVGRKRVFFVDASRPGSQPFSITKVHPAREGGASTHRLTPASLLQQWNEGASGPRPDCYVVAIEGEEFELGAPLSDAAEANLSAALAAVEKLLQ